MVFVSIVSNYGNSTRAVDAYFGAITLSGEERYFYFSFWSLYENFLASISC